MQRPTRRDVTERLRTFHHRPLPLPDGARRATVVLVIVDDADAGLGLWITRRAARMRAHPGQWAIPGGRVEAGESDVQGGLRELEEELAIHLDEDAVVGRLDDYATRSGFVVTPVVAWAGRPATAPVPNPAEVEELHLLTLEDLDVEPRFHEIPESDRPVVQLPILGDLIHAPTAAILHQFREVVLHGRDTRVTGFEQPVFAWR